MGFNLRKKAGIKFDMRKFGVRKLCSEFCQLHYLICVDFSFQIDFFVQQP